MKKSCDLFRISIFYFLSCLLFSCENFLEGNDIKNDVEKQIELANTPDVTVAVSCNNSYGTILSGSSVTEKLGTNNIELSFTESDAYQFVNWQVHDKDGNAKNCSKDDAIFIQNPNEMKTTFSILQNVAGYYISAECRQRPAVTLATPQFQTSGVNRDRAIIVAFNEEIPKINFRYSEEESAALVEKGCTLLSDSDGEAYGYIKDGVVFYKNIKIRNDNDKAENLLSFFGVPELSGNSLTINPKKGSGNQFELNSNNLKDLEVTVDGSVNKDGIKMRASYVWKYRVSNTTDEQTSINFTIDSKQGDITPFGSNKYSVGSEIKVKVTETDLYRFEGWEVSADESQIIYVAATGSVYDENNGVCETTFKVFEGGGDVSIKPVCAPRPVVESFAPDYITAGTDFDSTIVLNFTTGVARENFVYSQDEINAYGASATAVRIDPQDSSSDIIAVDVGTQRYFKNIIIKDEFNQNIAVHYRKAELSEDGKQLKISFDGSRLFDFKNNSVRDVYVTVNSSIYSVYKKSDETTENVLLSGKGKNPEFNFRVRNTSESKAVVNFNVFDGSTSMGSMTYNGINEFNLGQKISVIFAPSADYEFLRWSVTGDTDGSLLFDDDKTDTTLSFTVLGKADGIEIKPYCEKLNRSKILFETPSGTISPSGSQYVRRNEVVDLICKVNDKDCFAGWKVVNTVSDEVLSAEKLEKYFEFGDITSPETTMKVCFDSKNLKVLADTYARPEVYDHDPINQISGSNRDQSIRVFLTKGIDESTLYFSADEVAEYKKKGYEILDAGNNMKHKYYGCYKVGDFNSYIYKNLSIVNRGNTSENLLKHYGAPYLQNPEGTIIVIPVNTTDLPPKYKEIRVTLGTEYGYFSDDGKTLIGLYNNNLVFSYKTNDKLDDSKPKFSGVKFSGIKVDGIESDISSTELSAEAEPSYDNYKGYYLKPDSDGNIDVKLSIEVSDDGMNLNSLFMCMEQLRDNGYNELTNSYYNEYSLEMSVASTVGTFKSNTFRLSDYFRGDTMNGFYKVYFKATDLAGHESKSDDYYVLIDRHASKVINDQDYKFFVKNGHVKVTGLSKAAERDTKKTWIMFNDDDNKKYEITSDDIDVGFDKNQDVEIKIITEDWFGNIATFNSEYNPDFKQKAGASDFMYMYDDGYFSNSIIDASKIYGLVVSTDYSSENQKVEIAYKPNFKSTPNEIESGVYPDPGLTGKLSGCSYRIPEADLWMKTVSKNRKKFFDIGESLDKEEYRDGKLSSITSIPNRSYYYLKKDDHFVMYDAYMLNDYRTGYDELRYKQADMDNEYLVKYFITYEDSAN